VGRYRHDVLRHSDRLNSKHTGQHCIAKNLIYFLQRCHVLIPDRQFEDARQALLADGYVDEPFTYVRWTDLGAPCCEMRAWNYIHMSLFINILLGDPRSPESSSIFFLLGLSAVQPMFGDLDISSYKQIGGISFPPLLTLALSFLYALARSRTPKAYASVHCLAAGVITPSFVDTNLLVVTLWKVNRLKKS
jgi:hypothetical protein